MEGTRYLLSLLAPVLLAAAIALVARGGRAFRRASRSRRPCLRSCSGVAWSRACLVKPARSRLEIRLLRAVAAGARAGGDGSESYWSRGAAWRPRDEGRALRVALPALLALATGVWFLSFVNRRTRSGGSATLTTPASMLDETFAVLNGSRAARRLRTRLRRVWALVIAPLMALLGKTLLAYTSCCGRSASSTMLALFGVAAARHAQLARRVRAYLPLMAFAFFAASRDLDRPIAIYQEMPLRNVGPFLIAWLVARQPRPRRAQPPGRCSSQPGSRRSTTSSSGSPRSARPSPRCCGPPPHWTRRRAAGARSGRRALGFALAIAGCRASLTLILAGALPNPATGRSSSRASTRVGGVGAEPAAARDRAAARRLPHLRSRARRRDGARAGGAGNRALTGMLAWSAIFGFGSGVYYMGESVPRASRRSSSRGPSRSRCWRSRRAAAGTRAGAAAAARARRRAARLRADRDVRARPAARIAPWTQLDAVAHRG